MRPVYHSTSNNSCFHVSFCKFCKFFNVQAVHTGTDGQCALQQLTSSRTNMRGLSHAWFENPFRKIEWPDNRCSDNRCSDNRCSGNRYSTVYEWRQRKRMEKRTVKLMKI